MNQLKMAVLDRPTAFNGLEAVRFNDAIGLTPDPRALIVAEIESLMGWMPAGTGSRPVVMREILDDGLSQRRAR